MNDQGLLVNIGSLTNELEPLLIVIGLAVLAGFVLGYGVRAHVSKRRRRRGRS